MNYQDIYGFWLRRAVTAYGYNNNNSNLFVSIEKQQLNT